MIDLCLGNSAPPYIILAICLTFIAAIIGIIKQYRDHHVNMYKGKFGIVKLSFYIKFFIVCTFLLLTASLLNVFLSDTVPAKNFVHILIKLFLIISSYSFFFGLFEYYKKYKEELAVEED